MTAPTPVPLSPTHELLDSGLLPLPDVERAMGDLARLNRVLLGSRALCRTLLPRFRPAGRPLPVLDVGTGTGEVADDLARAAAARGCPLTVFGVDRQLTHLRLGRERGVRQIRVVADAAALPFRDGAFAWSFSTLFFHHFDAPTNRRILAEMHRTVAAGVAIVDLHRGRLLLALIRLALPLLGASWVTRHDGQASARKSWTLPEAAEIAKGFPVAELRRRFPFRFSLVIGKEG